MYISLKKESKCLREFLFSSVVQTVIDVLNPNYPSKATTMLFIKVVDSNNTVNVFGRREHIDKDNRIETNFSDLDYIMSINHESKYVICDEHWLVNIPFELAGLDDYKFTKPNKLIAEMEERYYCKFKKLLISNLSEIRKTVEYKKAYEKHLESEDYYRRDIRHSYLIGSNNKVDYIPKFFKNYNPYNNGTHFRLEESELDLLHSYLFKNSFMEDLAEGNFKEDFSFENVAYTDLINRLKEEILSNPDSTMKISKIIREAIFEAGKTLNIKIKGKDEVVKVKNILVDGDTFYSVKGFNSIKIEDIEGITFGKHILYKAE